MTRIVRRLPVVALAFMLAACGGDDPSADSTVDSSSTTTTGGTSTTTTGGTSTTPPDEALPGEPFARYPYEDAVLGVVGVAAEDTLKVRSGPGVEFDAILELDPLTRDLTATGRNRSLEDTSTWSEIRIGDDTGWANSAFLSHLGEVTDITEEVGPARAETMLELGQIVAASRASDEPPSTVVVVDGPSVGDLGEITVDVVGFGDDAVAGERLQVFAQPDPNGESFSLRTVEATLLCTRGVTEDGVCI